MDPLVQALVRQAMQHDDGSAGLEQELLQRQSMGPGAYRDFVNSNTLGERGQLAAQESRAQQEMVSQQLAQAQKFSQPQGRQYSTVGASVLGGLGDMVRQGVGGYVQGKLAGQQKDLSAKGFADQSGFLDQMDQSNNAAGNARFDAMQKFLASQQQPQGMQPPAGGQAPGGAPNFGMAQLRNPLLGLLGG